MSEGPEFSYDQVVHDRLDPPRGPMPETTAELYAKGGRPFAELRTTGLLWLINRTVLHPRGFALAIHLDDDGNATGWSLMGDGSESWNFDQSVVEDEMFRAVEALLETQRRTPS